MQSTIREIVSNMLVMLYVRPNHSMPSEINNLDCSEIVCFIHNLLPRFYPRNN